MSQVEQLQNQNEALEKENTELNGTIQMLRSEIQELSAFKDMDDDGDEGLKDAKEAAEARVAQLEEELEQARAQLQQGSDDEALQQQLEEQRRANEELAQQSQYQNGEIEHLGATIAQLQQQLQEARSAGELAAQSRGQSNDALDNALARARAEAEKSTQLQKENLELQAELRRRQSEPRPQAGPDLSGEVAKKEKEIKELQDMLKKVYEELQEKVDQAQGDGQLRSELQVALEENKRLQDTNAFMNPNAMKHYQQTIQKYEALRHKTTADVQKYRQLASKFKAQRSRLGEKDRELADLRTQLHQTEGEKAQGQADLAKLRKDYNNLGKQVGKLSSEIARRDPIKSKRVGQLKKLKGDYETLVKQFSTLKEETSKKERSLQELVQQLTKEKRATHERLKMTRRRLKEQRGFIVAYLEKQMHQLNNENTTSLEILREFLQNEEARTGRTAPSSRGRSQPVTPGGASTAGGYFEDLIARADQADRWYEEGVRAAGSRRPSGRKAEGIRPPAPVAAAPAAARPVTEKTPPRLFDTNARPFSSNGLGGGASKLFTETTEKKSYTFSSSLPKPSGISAGLGESRLGTSGLGLGSSAGGGGLNFTSTFKPSFTVTSSFAANSQPITSGPRPPSVPPSVAESIFSLQHKTAILNEDMKRKHEDTVSQFRKNLEARHRENQQKINQPTNVRVY